MRPWADFDRWHHSCEQLDRRWVAVQVSDPAGERWRGDNEIRSYTGGKGECILLRSLGDHMYTTVEPLDLVERWRITLWPRSDEVAGASVGRVLVDQRAVHLLHPHEAWVAQRPLRYHDAHVHQTKQQGIRFDRGRIIGWNVELVAESGITIDA